MLLDFDTHFSTNIEKYFVSLSLTQFRVFYIHCTYPWRNHRPENIVFFKAFNYYMKHLSHCLSKEQSDLR